MFLLAYFTANYQPCGLNFSYIGIYKSCFSFISLYYKDINQAMTLVPRLHMHHIQLIIVITLMVFSRERMIFILLRVQTQYCTYGYFYIHYNCSTVHIFRSERAEMVFNELVQSTCNNIHSIFSVYLRYWSKGYAKSKAIEFTTCCFGLRYYPDHIQHVFTLFSKYWPLWDLRPPLLLMLMCIW